MMGTRNMDMLHGSFWDKLIIFSMPLALTGVLQQIRPSLAKLDYKGVPSSKDKALVQRVAEQNAKDAATKLTHSSETLARRVREGQLKITYAMHDVATGKVTWFG